MSRELIYIGEINTPYDRLEDCPSGLQIDGPMCKITLLPKYEAGLIGLKRGTIIDIFYWIETLERDIEVEKKSECESSVGTFATRSPHRPNPIAQASVVIEHIDANQIFIKGMDCLNGTKLIDIKPAILSEIQAD